MVRRLPIESGEVEAPYFCAARAAADRRKDQMLAEKKGLRRTQLHLGQAAWALRDEQVDQPDARSVQLKRSLPLELGPARCFMQVDRVLTGRWPGPMSLGH